jgi:hypothetical protein
MPPNGAVPVEALLKLALDRSGAQEIQGFLDKQEKSFGRLEDYASRISGHFSGITRDAMGLVGIAGVAGVVNRLIGTAQSGALVGLASGHVTGGAGVGWGYGGAMLGAQAKTGVQAGEIAQGLIMAVQMTGGSPSPAQAAVLGGLLAGYGQTVGLAPSQVASIVGPLLQASNKSLTPGNVLSLGATLSGGLTNFPGSQAAPMLGLLSQLGVAQALGSGPAGGFTTGLGGLTAAVNTAAGANSIWRNAGITGGAINSISGGLQNAYGNPAMEAFLQLAGVSYQNQRKGFTPQNMQAIMGQATKEYGSGITRDLALRSMFGLSGADLLEQFSPGSHASQALQWALKNPHHPDSKALLGQINHAQLSHTPQADLNKIEARILALIQQHPVAAGAAGIAAWKGRGLIGKGLKGGAKGILNLFHRGGTPANPTVPDTWGEADGSVAAGADEAAGTGAEGILARVLGSGAMKLLGPLGFAAGFGLDAAPAGINDSRKYDEQTAVHQVLMEGLKKFGAHGVRSAAARNWMQQQLYAKSSAGVWGMRAMDQYGGRPGAALHGDAGKMLDQVLGVHWGGGSTLTRGGKQPVDEFSDASKTLLQAAQALQALTRRTGYASYNPSQSPLGVGGVQALGALAPGIEFASLIGGGSGGSNGTAFTAFTGGSGSAGGGGAGGAGGGGGAGWQSCTLTWYDPALGGTNSGSGRPDPNSPTASGQPYSASAMTCAAPSQYSFGTQITFSYNGKTVTCTVNDRGGAITGSHFDLSRGAAQALGMISAGRVGAKFRVSGSGSGSAKKSGGGSSGPGVAPTSPGQVFAAGDPGAGGVAGGAGAIVAAMHAAASGGAGHPSQQPIHVHVHVDSRQIRAHRVLLGHKR